MRLTVSSPIGNKWLRLYDMQVNVLHRAAQFAPGVTDGKGKAHPEVTDGKGYNVLTQAGGGELRYEIRTLAELKAIEIYWNPATWAAEAKPELEWTADGATWQTIGQLGTALTRVAAAPKCPRPPHSVCVGRDNKCPPFTNGVCHFAGNARDCADGSKSGAHDLANKAALDIYDLNGKLVGRKWQYRGLALRCLCGGWSQNHGST